MLGLEALGAPGDGPWAVLDERGALLAVYERYDGERAKPAVVLTASAAESGDTASDPGSLNDPRRHRDRDRSENEGAAESGDTVDR